MRDIRFFLKLNFSQIEPINLMAISTSMVRLLLYLQFDSEVTDLGTGVN